MARLSVVVLFLLFTLSVARSPLSKTENDVTVDELPGSALRLPSESNHEETDTTETETKVAVADITPLNIVRFRPINRHFRFRSVLPFRRCRHHFHRGHKSRLILRSGVEIPFGNDMILSSPENNNLGGVRQVPPEWIPLFHHHDHRRGDDQEKLPKYMSKRHRNFDHEKTKKNFNFHEKEAKEERENSLGRRIRKFLKRYFD